jgi:hypothetical protein
MTAGGRDILLHGSWRDRVEIAKSPPRAAPALGRADLDQAADRRGLYLGTGTGTKSPRKPALTRVRVRA